LASFVPFSVFVSTSYNLLEDQQKRSEVIAVRRQNLEV
jgi:hypothetical protein